MQRINIWIPKTYQFHIFYFNNVHRCQHNLYFTYKSVITSNLFVTFQKLIKQKIYPNLSFMIHNCICHQHTYKFDRRILKTAQEYLKNVLRCVSPFFGVYIHGWSSSGGSPILGGLILENAMAANTNNAGRIIWNKQNASYQ